MGPQVSNSEKMVVQASEAKQVRPDKVGKTAESPQTSNTSPIQIDMKLSHRSHSSPSL